MKSTPSLLLFITCAVSAAETLAPPPQPFEAQTWSSSMKRKPTSGIILGRWSIDFERATLSEILSRVAIGEIQHSGDGGESLYWLCYTVGGQAPARLWITSHGEVGGAERAVTGVVLVKLKSGKPASGCPALPPRLLPASLQGNLWTGMREGAVIKRLGAPSYRNREWISYNFEAKRPGDCPGAFDVYNSLLLRTNQGSIEAIYANQSTSC